MIIHFDDATLSKMHPAFIVIDRHLGIRKIGPTIKKHRPDVEIGQKINEIFKDINIDQYTDLNIISQMPVDINFELINNVTLSGYCSKLEYDEYILIFTILVDYVHFIDSTITINDFPFGDPRVDSFLVTKMQQGLLEEAKNIAIELDKHRLMVISLNKQIGKFAGFIAHDFNNILSIINLNLERIINNDEASNLYESPLSIISQSISRGYEVTSSLISISDQRSEDRELISVGCILYNNESFFDSVLGSTVSLDMQLQADGAIINATKRYFLNNIINLLINARDAMPSGGLAKVETCIRRAVLNNQIGERDYVAIRITDNGTGLNEDEASRAFEPFFTSKVGGTGIGLASVLDFCRSVGGDACIDSEAGEWTSVYMYIPLECADLKERSSNDMVPQIEIDNASILVVDDELYALEALAELLENEGLDVTIEASSVSAMKLLHDQCFDVVIADISMPDITGLQIASWIEEQSIATHVILMSGYTVRDAQIPPHCAYISKPIDFQKMKTIIMDMLRKSSLSLNG